MALLDYDAGDDARLADAFRDYVEDRAFPCVGAKSALATGSLNIKLCHDITSAWDDLAIHRDLLTWSREYAIAKDSGQARFRSLAIVFRQSRAMSEKVFERYMWERIQSLSDKDDWLEQPYDTSVSADTDDPHFGLSFGGQAYFVVGMHPGASRPARRFERPAMVFNLHDQFVQLRESQRYERMRETILERDKALAGDINPMLTRHGEASEAAQYSGRQVGDEWECPLRKRGRDDDQQD
ncbi:guanitoxin biosynthesis heme-dependent pre-guanitoxin N-hydroxylase GntA [Altererythrobacter sp.]|nr:guanitoxin biosynthesis heme-dependent pre-guanitoxin N-hydroxylase GntA [Altererythrobacter sp.]